MAALVQTLPQQTTVTMLSGPSSPGYAPQHQSSRSVQKSRYHNPTVSGNYRLPSGPVAPYAFTSTPQLTTTIGTSRTHPTPHLRSENRTVSAPVLPQPSLLSLPAANNPPLQLQNGKSTSTPLNTSLHQRKEDDGYLSLGDFPDFFNWPEPSLGLPLVGSAMPHSSMQASKPSPDRYRRMVRRLDSSDNGPNREHSSSSMPSGSGMAAVEHLYTHPSQSNSSPSLTTHQSYRGATHNTGSRARNTSVDDMNIGQAQNADLAKRYRRRSLGSLETAGLNHGDDTQQTASPHPNVFVATSGRRTSSRERQLPGQSQQQNSSHQHKGSSESASSGQSSKSQRPGSVSTSFFSRSLLILTSFPGTT